jgi:hypothetical protein
MDVEKGFRSIQPLVLSNAREPTEAQPKVAEVNQESKITKPLINPGRSFSVLMHITHSVVGVILILLVVGVFFKLEDNAKKTTVAYAVTQKGDRVRLHQFNEEDSVQKSEKYQLISDYATWMATSLHSYRWYLPGVDGTRTPDPGAKVPGGVLPTAVFMATLSMEPNFSLFYQPKMAALLKTKNVVDMRVESVFKPTKTSSPNQTGTDKWVVYVDGIQINTMENGDKILKRRYKKFTIVAAPVISPSIAQKAYKDPALQDAYMESASWGLMTIGIQDIDNSN